MRHDIGHDRRPDDASAVDRLRSLLRCVGGQRTQPGTSQAARPAHDLAAWPALFATLAAGVRRPPTH
ncbi:MAG: hypothetical protein H7306_06720 [Bacteriovorax sp.]|nr:hypothetical protein [Rhizobacter sp.]